VAEQRYEAVRAVIADGETVKVVAARFGVSRKTLTRPATPPTRLASVCAPYSQTGDPRRPAMNHRAVCVSDHQSRDPQAIKRHLPLPRGVQLLRIVWGAICVAAPSRVVTGLGQPRPDRRTVRVVRVLGVRHVVQGTASVCVPSCRVLAWGAAVDGLHSASMVAFGVADPQRQRLAWTDGVIAAGWGIVTFHGSRRASASVR
jgi:hypothetical protein